MKKLIFSIMTAVACVMSACSNEESLDPSVNPSDVQAPVTVRVADFSVEQGALTRATSVGDYTGVKFLTLAFYKSDGTEVYKVTHEKENMAEGQTFGEFSTSLAMGSYTMVVIGNGGTNAITLSSATSATYGEGRVRETFIATQDVNITSTSAMNLSATLNRIVTRLGLASTDNRPANVTKIRMTFSAGGKSFNPTTGLAIGNDGLTNTVEPTSAVGAATSVASQLFLASDEQTMNVTIETLDAGDNVVFSKTVNDVPFKRNRMTVLTGALYSASATVGSFQVNSDWLGDYNMNF